MIISMSYRSFELPFDHSPREHLGLWREVEARLEYDTRPWFVNMIYRDETGQPSREAAAVRNPTPNVAASSLDMLSGTLKTRSSAATQYSAALPMLPDFPP
jgi:hypothetical protein